MKNIILVVVLFTFFSCSKSDELSIRNKVLVLKVDHTTHTFRGGDELIFLNKTSTFTIVSEYRPPGDFGYIRLKYQELDAPLFDGDIIWAGTGKIKYPQGSMTADQFSRVTTNDTIYPNAGFENILGVSNKNREYEAVWLSIQNLTKVREYLKTNPNATVKLFLYTPSVGVIGDVNKSQWIIFLKN
ncbi:MAG: hypothetical protein EAZ55_12345 [Cytophagales bacterium]|nr:MAG: hypothetical protein EAZ55_12345 [Cytophagales bacterium]